MRRVSLNPIPKSTILLLKILICISFGTHSTSLRIPFEIVRQKPLAHMQSLDHWIVLMRVDQLFPRLLAIFGKQLREDIFKIYLLLVFHKLFNFQFENGLKTFNWPTFHRNLCDFTVDHTKPNSEISTIYWMNDYDVVFWSINLLRASKNIK